MSGAAQVTAEYIRDLLAENIQMRDAIMTIRNYFIDEAGTLGMQLMDGSIHAERRGAIRVRMDGHLHRAAILGEALTSATPPRPNRQAILDT